MNKFLTYIQEAFGYSDYEIALLKYFITVLFYEISKLIVFGIFFYAIGYIAEYLVATGILLILRTSIGGIHFNTFIGCSLFTFLFYVTGIIFLPSLYVNKTIILSLLLTSIFITYVIGPITSSQRKEPDDILIKKSKIHACLFILLYCLISIFYPVNEYIIIGFWFIMLQTFQLIVAFILKTRRFHNEK